jgi:hypothetical protein
LRIWIQPDARSHDIQVDHNSSTGPPGWPGRASVTIFDATDSEVDHNSVVVNSYMTTDPGDPFATGGPGTEVDFNTIAGTGPGRPTVVQGGALACSNVSPANVPLDASCRSIALIAGPAVAHLPS